MSLYPERDDRVPNAKEGRDSVEFEVFGMQGWCPSVGRSSFV